MGLVGDPQGGDSTVYRVVNDGNIGTVFVHADTFSSKGPIDPRLAKIQEINPAQYSVSSTSGAVTVRTGTAVVGVVTINVTVVQDSRVPNSHAVHMETTENLVNTVGAFGGPKYTNAPTTGSFTYTGTQITNSTSSQTPASTGSFTMLANFSDETFEYNGTSGSVTVEAKGNMFGDEILPSGEAKEFGHFRANSLDESDPEIGYEDNNYGLVNGAYGYIYGQFSADSAAEVAGTIYSRDASIVGTFIGGN